MIQKYTNSIMFNMVQIKLLELRIFQLDTFVLPTAVDDRTLDFLVHAKCPKSGKLDGGLLDETDANEINKLLEGTKNDDNNDEYFDGEW